MLTPYTYRTHISDLKFDFFLFHFQCFTFCILNFYVLLCLLCWNINRTSAHIHKYIHLHTNVWYCACFFRLFPWWVFWIICFGLKIAPKDDKKINFCHYRQNFKGLSRKYNMSFFFLTAIIQSIQNKSCYAHRYRFKKKIFPFGRENIKFIVLENRNRDADVKFT